jgi:beta-lactam-binding protein with PASTA domain
VKGRRLLRLLVALPLSLATAAASAWLVVSFFSPRGDEIPVPDLRGMEVGSALEAASRKELAVALAGYAYHSSIPARHVISQTPEADAPTRKNRILRVVVSRGTRDISTPDLAGMDLRRASLVLAQTGLLAGRTAGVHAPGTAAGEVIAQTPGPRTLLSRGEKVDLLLSQGPPLRLLLMGDLSSLPLAEGLRILRGWRLFPGAITSRALTGFPPGSIAATSPPAGHPVAQGSQVEITVSSLPR